MQLLYFITTVTSQVHSARHKKLITSGRDTSRAIYCEPGFRVPVFLKPMLVSWKVFQTATLYWLIVRCPLELYLNNRKIQNECRIGLKSMQKKMVTVEPNLNRAVQENK